MHTHNHVAKMAWLYRAVYIPANPPTTCSPILRVLRTLGFTTVPPMVTCPSATSTTCGGQQMAACLLRRCTSKETARQKYSFFFSTATNTYRPCEARGRNGEAEVHSLPDHPCERTGQWWSGLPLIQSLMCCVLPWPTRRLGTPVAGGTESGRCCVRLWRSPWQWNLKEPGFTIVRDHDERASLPVPGFPSWSQLALTDGSSPPTFMPPLLLC